MTAIINHRYVLLHELGRGGMGVVYRAQDRLTGHIVALKQVLMPDPTLRGFDTDPHELRLALSREFKVLAGLRHPHIISVLDFGFDSEQQPFFTMEFLEKAETITVVGEDVPLAVKINLLVQALEALAYLHRWRILHRDIKPANMLVTERRLRLLDFGLSINRDQAAEHETSGTLDYLAPEMLTGGGPSEASDLYQIGVIAWELLAGRFPYDRINLVDEIIHVMPDSPDLDDRLKAVLQRLLDKIPEHRYQNAYTVIRDLQQAAGITVTSEIAGDIQEAFLKAAPFTGRDFELATLRNELDMLRQGHGKIWLVGGASGIGKSRLLEELRTYALVDGIQVLRGQETREATTPYALWRDVVRRLALMVTLSDMQISILKAIAPDITTLLDRDVPDAPLLEGSAAQDRLFTVIENMFLQCRFPTLVLLEDLHWSDNPALLLLVRMLRVVRHCPVLFVASYRDEERPDLPGNVPDAAVLRLKRLDDATMTTLAEAMLGEVSRRPQVAGVLNSESGGNVFFLIEVIRALAHQAGGLSGIGQMTLPARIFAGGIQEIIQRRLNAVPETDRALLQLAAVGGRQIDMSVLRYAAPDALLDFWLVDCATAGILEVEDAHWRFTSNRFRDGILDALDEETLRQLHRRIAQAMEAAYPNGGGQSAVLARHYEMAGETLAAGAWYFSAGCEMQAAYLPDAAIHAYEKALHYLPDTSQYRSHRLQALSGLGRMLRWQARFDEALRVYETMRAAAEVTGDMLMLAQAFSGLDDVENSKGHRQAALAYAERAESAARAVGAAGPGELISAMSSRAWSLYRLKQTDKALEVAAEALKMAEQHQLPGAVARNLSLIAILKSLAHLPDEAIETMQKALAVTRELGDRRDIGIKLNNLGELYRLQKQYAEALRYFQEAVDIFAAIGYRDAELALLTNMGSVRLAMGEATQAESHLQQVVELTGGRGWWGLGETWATLARALLYQDKHAAALEAAQNALREGRATEDKDIEGRAWRLMGRALSPLKTTITVDDVAYDTPACFKQSLALFGPDTAARAYTLKAWSIHEQEHGDAAASDAIWKEAEAIFIQLGIFDPLDE